MNFTFLGMTGIAKRFGLGLAALLLAVLSISRPAIGMDLAVIDTIPLPHPRGLAISPDGSELYVQFKDDVSNYIAVVDTASNSVVDQIPYNGGYLMDLSPDGSRLFIAGNGQLEVIDLSSRAALSPIAIPGAGSSLAGVAVSPDGSKAFVSNYGTGTGYVYVIDTQASSYMGTIVADPWGWPFVMGIDIDPGGSYAYVASRKYGHLDVLDLTTLSRADTLNLGFGSSSILTNVTVIDDGSRAYITNAQYSFISVVDTDPVSPNFHQEVAWFDTGASGLGKVTFNADLTRGFVTDGPWGTNRIFIFDSDPASPSFHDVLGEVEVGNRPWQVQPFESGNQIAYVSVWDPQTEGGGYVAVLGSSQIEHLACNGFEPPADRGPITVRKNRAIPFKAGLINADGFGVTSIDIEAAPVIQVLFLAEGGPQAIDVTDDALPAGASSDGNTFTFVNDHWRYNLKTSNYSAPGTYLVSVASGDLSEYQVRPTCAVSLLID